MEKNIVCDVVDKTYDMETPTIPSNGVSKNKLETKIDNEINLPYRINLLFSRLKNFDTKK